MDHLPPTSYIKTPYFRLLGQSPSLTQPVTEDPDTNMDPYYLFCVKTKFQYVLPNTYLVYRTIELEDRMQLVLAITNATNPVTLTEETHKMYTSYFNELLNYNQNECLVFEATEAFSFIPIWYQEWMVPVIDVPSGYKLRLGTNPVTGRQGIYADFRAITSDDDYFHDYIYCFNFITTSLQNEIVSMYKNGYIQCTEEIANKYELTMIKQIDEQHWLACVDWDYVDIVKDNRIVEFLLDKIEN
jgi:hypothetical protein